MSSLAKTLGFRKSPAGNFIVVTKTGWTEILDFCMRSQNPPGSTGSETFARQGHPGAGAEYAT
jgi:hypothetical protein